MGNLKIIIVFSLVSFFLFQPLVAYSIENENKKEFFKRCPPFRCGKLGILSFPFTNRSESEVFNCSPFVVSDCDHELPKIQLTSASNKWYLLHNVSESQKDGEKWINITITDSDLHKHLQSRDCQSFTHLNFPHLNFPHLNFPLLHPKLLTLIKCNRTLHQLPSPPHFEFEYNKCRDFSIYYNRMNGICPPTPPPNCKPVVLPVNPFTTDESYHNIFELLTATVSVQVSISVNCYLCPPKEGKCQQNSAGEWRCLNSKGSEVYFFPKGAKLGWKWKVAIGTGSSAIVLVVLMLIIFFWHKYKKRSEYDPSHFNGTKRYSATYSKSDVEGANNFFGVSVFSYTELEEATNCFAVENELGNGGFGTVYYGKLKDGREVAVKRLYERNYRKVEQFLNEIEILTNLRHSNLVSLYGCTSRRSRELLLVYEYIPNGTVADHLHGNQSNPRLLTWPIRMRIAVETASALVYLHASGIVHRDVKTNNILLDNHYSVKVADFGISRLFPTDVTHISTAPQGTPGYVDPEYYQCYQLTDKSDVYSFGVVLVELISSLPAVDITRHRHEINLANLAVNKIQTCAFDELIDPFLGHQTDEEVNRMITSVAELAFLCLQSDKEMRPAMVEVLDELQRIGNRESQMENLANRYLSDM